MRSFAERMWAAAPTDSRVFVIAAWVVVGLTLVVVAFAVFLMVHHAVTEHRRRRRRLHQREAAIMLAPVLTAPDGLEKAVRETEARWGREAVSDVLRRARTELKGDPATRISEVLETIGEVDHLLPATRSGAPWKRAAAVRQLGECGGPRAREVLLGATDDPIPEVRRAARDGLLLDRGVESIRAAIHSYLVDAPSRSAWRRSFYARLAAVAAPQLRQLLEEGVLQPTEQKLALEALGDARNQESFHLAARMVESADPELRATAVRVLGKLGDEAGMPLVEARLEDPEWFVRAAAARAMGTLPCHQAECGRLGECLRDEAWWVRTNAAHALADQGHLGADILLAALETSDRYARHSALTALAFAELGPAQQGRLAELLGRLPTDGLDQTAVSFLRSNLALERI